MRTNVHSFVFASLRGHPRAVCAETAVQLAARALVWLPPLLAPSLSAAVLILWGFFGYALLILPLRFRAACLLEKLTGDPAASPAPYLCRVLGGGLRLLAGGVWGIPLFFLLGLIYRYAFVLDASKYAEAVRGLGAVVMPSRAAADQQMAGLLIFGAGFAVSLALFGWGWRRGVLFEYVMKRGVSLPESRKRLREIRKAHALPLLQITCVNFLIMTPAVLLPLALFSLCSGGTQQAALSLFFMVSAGMIMEPAPFWGAIVLFFVLYLPFVLYRKGCYAALVNQYDEQR